MARVWWFNFARFPTGNPARTSDTIAPIIVNKCAPGLKSTSRYRFSAFLFLFSCKIDRERERIMERKLKRMENKKRGENGMRKKRGRDVGAWFQLILPAKDRNQFYSILFAIVVYISKLYEIMQVISPNRDNRKLFSILNWRKDLICWKNIGWVKIFSSFSLLRILLSQIRNWLKISKSETFLYRWWNKI